MCLCESRSALPRHMPAPLAFIAQGQIN
jgi:hypothetical protein